MVGVVWWKRRAPPRRSSTSGATPVSSTPHHDIIQGQAAEPTPLPFSPRDSEARPSTVRDVRRAPPSCYLRQAVAVVRRPPRWSRSHNVVACGGPFVPRIRLSQAFISAGQRTGGIAQSLRIRSCEIPRLYERPWGGRPSPFLTQEHGSVRRNSVLARVDALQCGT